MVLLPNKRDHQMAGDNSPCRNGIKRNRMKDNDAVLKVENSDFVILNASTTMPSAIGQSHRNTQTRANQVNVKGTTQVDKKVLKA
jgi:hypothetical protein